MIVIVHTIVMWHLHIEIYMTAASCAKSKHLFIMCQAAKVKSCPSTANNSVQLLESIAIANSMEIRLHWTRPHFPFLPPPPTLHPSASGNGNAQWQEASAARRRQRPEFIYYQRAWDMHTSARQDKLQIFAGSLFATRYFSIQHLAFQYLRYDPRGLIGRWGGTEVSRPATLSQWTQRQSAGTAACHAMFRDFLWFNAFAFGRPNGAEGLSGRGQTRRWVEWVEWGKCPAHAPYNVYNSRHFRSPVAWLLSSSSQYTDANY